MNIFIYQFYSYVMVVNGCYDYGFISAKTNGPYFVKANTYLCPKFGIGLGTLRERRGALYLSPLGFQAIKD